jgi:hypothetical protein
VGKVHQFRRGQGLAGANDPADRHGRHQPQAFLPGQPVLCGSPKTRARNGHVRGLAGGQAAGGVPVPDRVSPAVELVLSEEHGELDLAGAGAPVLALPGPACAIPCGTWTPVPSMQAYSLSGGDGSSGTSLRAVISAARSRSAEALAAPLGVYDLIPVTDELRPVPATAVAGTAVAGSSCQELFRDAPWKQPANRPILCV